MAFGPHWFKRDTDDSQEAARQRALLDGMRAIQFAYNSHIARTTLAMVDALKAFLAAGGKLDDE